MIVPKGAIMRPIVVCLALWSGTAWAQDPTITPPPEPPPVYTPQPIHLPKVSGQKERGFAMEGRVGTQLLALTGVGTIGAVGGGVFAGYKIDRVIVGLGFDVARVATSTTQPGSDMSDATTAFFFTPGIRVAIVRSQDQRVDFFGLFDLGLGTVVQEESPPPTGTQPDVLRFRLKYDLGPGVRFWAHPQFAVGAVAGVHGDFAYTKTSTTIFGTTTTSSQSTTLTSIFAALQLMGVF
jgi:hypothetical protein